MQAYVYILNDETKAELVHAFVICQQFNEHLLKESKGKGHWYFLFYLLNLFCLVLQLAWSHPRRGRLWGKKKERKTAM